MFPNYNRLFDPNCKMIFFKYQWLLVWSVWRDGLWQKLLTHGIQGKTFDVIKNMYNEIKSCVTVNGCSSGFFKCQQGVRQGENLSPLLFSVYLNDLDYFMHTSGCKGLEVTIHDHEYIIFLI